MGVLQPPNLKQKPEFKASFMLIFIVPLIVAFSGCTSNDPANSISYNNLPLPEGEYTYDIEFSRGEDTRYRYYAVMFGSPDYAKIYQGKNVNKIEIHGTGYGSEDKRITYMFEGKPVSCYEDPFNMNCRPEKSDFPLADFRYIDYLKYLLKNHSLDYKEKDSFAGRDCNWFSLEISGSDMEKALGKIFRDDPMLSKVYEGSVIAYEICSDSEYEFPVSYKIDFTRESLLSGEKLNYFSYKAELKEVQFKEMNDDQFNVNVGFYLNSFICAKDKVQASITPFNTYSGKVSMLLNNTLTGEILEFEKDIVMKRRGAYHIIHIDDEEAIPDGEYLVNVCLEDYGCQEDPCSRDTTKQMWPIIDGICHDTDGGKTPEVKGKVEFDTGREFNDYCLSDELLVEMYCEDNLPKQIVFGCECNEQEDVCTDF